MFDFINASDYQYLNEISPIIKYKMDLKIYVHMNLWLSCLFYKLHGNKTAQEFHANEQNHTAEVWNDGPYFWCPILTKCV